MASAVPCLLVCLVLLVSPYLGSSYHTSYTHGGRHYVLRSNRDPRQPKQTPTCSSPEHTGTSSSDALPVVHRLSPCSPLGAARNQQLEKPSVADVLHRDALRLSSLFRERRPKHIQRSAPAPASASAPTSPAKGGGEVSIGSRGDPIKDLPGAFEYHVTVGFGTPVQQFTVGFDTTTTGATLLRCKPCAADEPCDNAFDPSASSSISQIPCGSPDCPFHGCSSSGPSCTLSVSVNDTLLGNATFFTDTLTLAPWFFSTVENFRFACLEAGFAPEDSSTGILDLSRNSHSLASRAAPSSPRAVAFSYCLPPSPSVVGFLSLGATKPELLGRKVSYTPLRSNPHNGNQYVVELVGLRVGGVDIPVPPSTIAGGGTILELHTTFTYLKPKAYAALRDNFRESMSEYPMAPPLGCLDTCYNFTGLNSFGVPAVTLKFDGAAELDLGIDEMLYFPDPKNRFSMACLAFAAQDDDNDSNVIGSMAQMSTEVVYDVRGGKVGFVPDRCSD